MARECKNCHWFRGGWCRLTWVRTLATSSCDYFLKAIGAKK